MLKNWACHICQSDKPQAAYCCGLKSCEYSLYRNKTIEEMIRHMILKHGAIPPNNWDKLQKVARNKAKRNRKKDKRRKRGK